MDLATRIAIILQKKPCETDRIYSYTLIGRDSLEACLKLSLISTMKRFCEYS